MPPATAATETPVAGDASLASLCSNVFAAVVDVGMLVVVSVTIWLFATLTLLVDVNAPVLCASIIVEASGILCGAVSANELVDKAGRALICAVGFAATDVSVATNAALLDVVDNTAGVVGAFALVAVFAVDTAAVVVTFAVSFEVVA
jgi:hypothetical protein